MTRQHQYIVHAFTKRVFSGNPAAICVVDAWPDDETMRLLAVENRLSETAFALRLPAREGDGADVVRYQIRWFTPGGEIDLCGHATLATSYVLFSFVEPSAQRIEYVARGGAMTVTREGVGTDMLVVMDFPAYDLHQVAVTDAMEAALGARPVEAWMGRDLLCVYDDPATVHAMAPNQQLVFGLDGLLCHVTAPGEEGTGFDAVSRSFAPKHKIDEDPVCGTGHCHVVPYWAARTGRDELLCYQASARGGVLHTRIVGNRVVLAGNAVLFSEGDVFLP